MSTTGLQLKKADGTKISPKVNSSDITWDTGISLGDYMYVKAPTLYSSTLKTYDAYSHSILNANEYISLDTSDFGDYGEMEPMTVSLRPTGGIPFEVALRANFRLYDYMDGTMPDPDFISNASDDFSAGLSLRCLVINESLLSINYQAYGSLENMHSYYKWNPNGQITVTFDEHEYTIKRLVEPPPVDSYDADYFIDCSWLNSSTNSSVYGLKFEMPIFEIAEADCPSFSISGSELFYFNKCQAYPN